MRREKKELIRKNREQRRRDLLDIAYEEAAERMHKRDLQREALNFGYDSFASFVRWDNRMMAGISNYVECF